MTPTTRLGLEELNSPSRVCVRHGEQYRHKRGLAHGRNAGSSDPKAHDGIRLPRLRLPGRGLSGSSERRCAGQMPALPNRPLYAARIQALRRARDGRNIGLRCGRRTDGHWLAASGWNCVPQRLVSLARVVKVTPALNLPMTVTQPHPRLHAARSRATALPAPHRTAPAGHRRMGLLA
jgi:hypothetical protein